MSDALHDFSAWLFFHDVVLSPPAIFGAICLGWWLRIAHQRRRLWLHFTRLGRDELWHLRRFRRGVGQRP